MRTLLKKEWRNAMRDKMDASKKKKKKTKTWKIINELREKNLVG